MTNTAARITVVIFSLALIWAWYRIEYALSANKIQCETQVRSLTHQVDSLNWLADSLRDEAFTSHVELGRFEMALEIFLERNPKAAAEYSTIISEETE